VIDYEDQDHRFGRSKLRSTAREANGTNLLDGEAHGSITLVVDDGPSGATETLLSHLEEAGHRAVLFIVGEHLTGGQSCPNPDFVRRREMLVGAVRRGFALGNHSFDHVRFSSIGCREARTSLERADRLVEDIYARAGVRRPGKWFRFPYLDTGGDQAAEFQDLLRDLGFEQPASITQRMVGPERERVDWPSTLRTYDWEDPPEPVFRARLQLARPGDVVEFHDFPRTVAPYGRALAEGLSNLSLRATIPADGEVRQASGGRL
jgi:peptidoglycan/xylan/chitin deacetylase (PgdA/CDA1 family)